MSTNNGVKQAVGNGIRILSFDSGGPGAYSQLLILKEYMVRLANDLGVNEGDLYPADYFDLMGGVGFGGLVAILLGHLRMNVDETIDALLDVALTIFPDDPPISDPELRTGQLRESIENLLQIRGVPIDRKMQETSEEPAGCKVALYAATTTNLTHPIVLRTYKPRGSSFNPTIVEAICATMAIPSYFSPIKCGPRGRQQVFVGGPHGANNPTRELLKEASGVFGKEKLVAQIISLGSGRSHTPSMGQNSRSDMVDRSVQEMAADCEAVAKELSMRLRDMKGYLRLSVERGMENVLMNQWDDLGPIEIHTSAYVETADVSDNLEASLKRLQGNVGTVTLGEINHPSAAKEVRDKLDKHKKDLDHALMGVKENEDSRLLDRLNPVNALSYYEGRRCMKDTRKLILDHIFTWAEAPLEKNNPSNSTDLKNLFWLYGSPGLGKTSLANSLCHQLHKNRHLGGSFFCRRDDPVLCDPNRVLPTLLYKLAWMWSPYRDLVTQAFRTDPNLNPDWTGCSLLLEQLYSLQDHPHSRLVLVIDALDESGDPRTRAPLLKCFSEIASRVDWLKIILTSRPEYDISSFFQKLGVFGHDLSTDHEAHHDIRIFAKYRMASLAEQYHLPSDWPGESRLEDIARRSGGLFIFVETLYQFLDDPNPELLLSQVLSGMLGEANAELHRLYSTAIATRIGRCRDEFRLFVQALVTVATRRSLPDRTLASLIGLEPGVVSSWVDGLSSLLYRDASENGGIRARHLSVIEFLIGPTCPAEFRVNLQEANGQLGHRCLLTMMKELEFNVCKLETSCVPNTDIQDLDDRVRENISDALQYSCIHWFSHLCSGPSAASEVSELLSILLTGVQLLYWLEVLSLMGKVPVAILALRLMKASSNKFEDHHQRPIEDALRFVMACFTAISTSAPHIYISGLPFMPAECSVWKCASLLFTELISLCNGRMKSWPALSGMWRGHTNRVRCVAYSPDGRNIVSCSDDHTIRIWDAQTGASVGEPLKGHAGSVSSVAYSPDGRNLVSGSHDGMIRIWDAETGKLVEGPTKGHAGWVWSVAYTRDGLNVISGSEDHTIRIWDAQTGAPVGELLKGHTGPVCCLTCSPDGRNIISGSGDKTIRIWDVQTGAAVGKPLKGHTGSIWSIACSPDGQNIISGSGDNTIRIWDMETGVAVGEPLQGHTERIRSVACSPDGRHIASGSTDKTIRIWDVRTGAVVGKPLTGHTGSLWSVSYSPDGRHVISGSGDHTVRMWDTQTGAVVGEPPKGHTRLVRSIACSPDGQNVVSGAYDSTLRIWDVHTGAAVGESLKGHIEPVYCVAYSPDGRNIASGSRDNTILIWDVQSGAAVEEPLKGHTEAVWSIAYSPDGQRIVSGSEDNTIRIWDMQTAAEAQQLLMGLTDTVFTVAYSPDGRNIVSGSRDNTIRFWDATTGAAVGEPLIGHTRFVFTVAYSPDGRYIASGSWDATVRIWDAQSGAPTGKALTGHTGAVWSVAYSPDGRRIVSGSEDKTIRIWDVEVGSTVGESLKGHIGPVYCVAWALDGRNVISGSYDDTVRIWNAEIEAVDGKPQTGHIQSVLRVAYSQDGQNVESGSQENTTRVLKMTSNMKDGRIVLTESNKLSNTGLLLNALSGLHIPTTMLDSNGWVRGTEGLLFWVPEDCRNGLTCPSTVTMPNSGRHQRVRIDFSRFQYGTSWTKIRGSNNKGAEFEPTHLIPAQ